MTQTLQAFNKIDDVWVKSNWPLGWPNFFDENYVIRRNFHVRPIVPWLVRNLDFCVDTDWPDDVDRQLPEAAVNGHLSYYEFDERFFDTLIFLNTHFDQYITKVKAAAQAKYGPDFDQPF